MEGLRAAMEAEEVDEEIVEDDLWETSREASSPAPRAARSTLLAHGSSLSSLSLGGGGGGGGGEKRGGGAAIGVARGGAQRSCRLSASLSSSHTLAQLPSSPIRRLRADVASPAAVRVQGALLTPGRNANEDSVPEEMIGSSRAETPHNDRRRGAFDSGEAGCAGAGGVLDEGARLLDEWLASLESSPLVLQGSNAKFGNPWSMGVAGVPELECEGAEEEFIEYEDDFLDEDIEDEEEVDDAFDQCGYPGATTPSPEAASGRATPLGGLEAIGHGIHSTSADTTGALFAQLHGLGPMSTRVVGDESGPPSAIALRGQTRSSGWPAPSDDELKSSMGQRQASAQAEAEAISASGRGVEVGVATGRGRRLHMEDYVQLRVLRVLGLELLYFGVFDGHNGPGSARAASRQLHQLLRQRIEVLARGNPQLGMRRKKPIAGDAGWDDGTDETSQDSVFTSNGSPTLHRSPSTRRGVASRQPNEATSSIDSEWAHFKGGQSSENSLDGCQSSPEHASVRVMPPPLPNPAVDALLSEALYESFLLLDAWLKRHKRIVESRCSSRQASASRGGNNRPSSGKVIQGGTTALVVVINNDVIHLASAGDSRAVLVRANGECRLTTDHSPSLPAEAERIESLGGLVLRGRVHGILAVSRAMGDPELQPYVTPEPQVSMLRRRSDDRALLLGSDGIWGEVQEGDARAIVSAHPNAQAAAQSLVDTSDSRGGRDNSSAIVITWSGLPTAGA